MSFVTILCAVAVSAQQPVGSRDARSAPAWLTGSSMYQVFLSAFSAGGKLPAVTQKMPYIADLGAGIIYLSPLSRMSDKPAERSPYLAQNYYAIDPTYGTEADFHQLIEAAHQRGIRVMMDIVFYHASSDNVMMKTPEYYMHDQAGRVVLGAWKAPRPDFQNPALRQYLIASLLHWVRDFHVDGFRCDVSGGIPLSFWEQARAELDKVSRDVILLAEGDMPEDQLAAFDLNYNYPFYYFPLAAVMRDGEPASRLRTEWERAHAMFPRGARFLHFSDNHDQPRSVVLFGEKGALAAAVLNFALDGIPYVYNGQEFGAVQPGTDPTAWGDFWPLRPDPPHPFARPDGVPIPDFGGVAAISPQAKFRLFQRLFHMRKEEAALHSGEVIWVNNSAPNDVVSFLRKKGGEEILTIINLSNRARAGVVDLPWAEYRPLKNLIDDKIIQIPIQEGRIPFTLGAFDFIVGKRVAPLTLP